MKSVLTAVAAAALAATMPVVAVERLGQ